MPKETVYSSPGSSGFQAQVSWHKDADMQVGITTPLQSDGQHHLVDYIYGSEVEHIGRLFLEKLQSTGRNISDDDWDAKNPAHDIEIDDENLGRMILDSVTGSSPFGTSVWWTPTRHQVNMFIRLLRKARDAAFGRDE